MEILRLMPCGFMSLTQACLALASTLTRDINKVWHTIAHNWPDGTNNEHGRGNASDKLLTSMSAIDRKYKECGRMTRLVCLAILIGEICSSNINAR